MSDLFEQASRKKLRFPSVKGELTVENLWDLPLQSKSGFDLDTVAKGVNTALKSDSEESFVTASSNPRAAENQLRLDILRHVIAERLKDAERARQREARLDERRRLVEALSAKQSEQILGMSPEAIRKRIEEIDAAA